MGHRYGKLPAELLNVPIEDFILNMAVYLWSAGERARDHYWDEVQRKSQNHQA